MIKKPQKQPFFLKIWHFWDPNLRFSAFSPFPLPSPPLFDPDHPVHAFGLASHPV